MADDATASLQTDAVLAVKLKVLPKLQEDRNEPGTTLVALPGS